MTHDVKTPLASIIGLSKLLTYHLVGEDLEVAKNLLGASRELLKFFNDCIELSKLECEGIHSMPEIFDLRSLLGEISNLFAPAVKEKKLSFHIDYDASLPTSLLGNRTNIYRIMLNLTGNAIKFTHLGSVIIRAELAESPMQGVVQVKLAVKDTGIGMPKDQQHIIFERFARLTPMHSETTYEGHGIGLYAVKKFVEAMQGEIFVKSERGEGSEFIVTLPLQTSC